MKIKEVEQRVGITKANIRYYEDEGLITPLRNRENNYREYSEEDVKRLEQIKVLRMLGVSLGDIKLLIGGGATLDDVMDRRLAQIQEERKNLEDIKKVCQTIRQRDISFESIDESVLGDEKDAWVWRERLERIMTEDITQEILTRRQLNTNMGVMLGWGYLLNAIIALVFGNWLLEYQGKNLPAFLSNMEDAPYMRAYADGIDILGISSDYIFIGAVIISIILYMAMYFTASVKAHLVIFHVAVLVLTPFVAGIYNIFRFLAGIGRIESGKMPNLYMNGFGLAAFWLMMVLYVGLLWILSNAWEGFFSKARYVVGVASVYTVVFTVAAGIACKIWILPAILFFAFTYYIGLNWYHTYDEGEGRNRYYAVVNCTRTMNLAGVMQNMKGLTRGPFVLR